MPSGFQGVADASPMAGSSSRGALGSLVDTVMSMRRGSDPQSRMQALDMLSSIGNDPSSVFQELIVQEMMNRLRLKRAQRQNSSKQGGMAVPDMTSASSFGTLF